MKKFETPEIKIVTFQVEDVITTSGDVTPMTFRLDELKIG